MLGSHNNKWAVSLLLLLLLLLLLSTGAGVSVLGWTGGGEEVS